MARTEIRSSQIKDSEIANVDIAADAAIVYSKLSIADADLSIAKTSGLQSALDLKAPKLNPELTNGYEKTQTLTSGASIAWDMDSGGFATVTLDINATMSAPSNLKNGGSYILVVKQDGTGSRTLAYNAVFKWAGGTAPTLSTAINSVDIITFISDGTNLYGVMQGDFK